MAIQFLTVITIPDRLVGTHQAPLAFGRRLAFFPDVGQLIGVGALVSNTISRPVPGVTTSVLLTLSFLHDGCLAFGWVPRHL